MINQDIDKFAVIMATLSECFGKEISEKKLEVYFAALRDLTIEQVAAAAHWLINNRTLTSTFPLVAEIRQAVDYCQHNSMSVDDRAHLAWRKLIWAIEQYGYYYSVQFDDSIIHQVVRALGGWTHIAGDNPDWYESQLQWRQKDFLALYKALAKISQSHCPNDHLPGLFELTNPDTKVSICHIAGIPGRLNVTSRTLLAPNTAPQHLIDHLADQVTKHMSNHQGGEAL